MPTEFGEHLSRIKTGVPNPKLKGRKRSQEVCDKIRAGHAARPKVRKPMSSGQRQHLSDFWKGKPKSEQTRAKMRKPHSIEHIANRVAARKRNKETRLALVS